MWDLIEKVWNTTAWITAFAFVGVVMWVSVVLSKRLTFGRIPRLGDCHRHRPGAGLGRRHLTGGQKAWRT
jgi:hypothetical protein